MYFQYLLTISILSGSFFNLCILLHEITVTFTILRRDPQGSLMTRGHGSRNRESSCTAAHAQARLRSHRAVPALSQGLREGQHLLKEVPLPLTRRSTRGDLSWLFSLERKESVEKLHFQIPIDLLELNQLQDYKCLSTQDPF